MQRLEKYDQAISSITRGLTINLSVHSSIHPSVLQCYEWLSLVYKSKGDLYAALKYEEKAKDLSKELKKLGIENVGERIVD